MPNVSCAVLGCSNSTYRLKKWRKERCYERGNTDVVHKFYGCKEPFHLFCFPSIITFNEERKLRIDAMKRVMEKSKKWLPTESDRVCSLHFADGQPILANPIPSLNLGYDVKAIKPRRIVKHAPPYPTLSKKQKLDMKEQATQNETELIPDAVVEHFCCIKPGMSECSGCISKRNLIVSMADKLKSMTLQMKKLKLACTPINFVNNWTPMTWRKIKTDRKMNFYTGIATIQLFHAVFLLIKPYLHTITYWKGCKRTLISSKIRSNTRSRKLKKICQQDQFLLTLMRIRLNLMNEDLADRFGISTGLCSETFTTWIISQVLGTALLVWLPRESIQSNLPNCFKKMGYSKCRIILDCTEVFIERPKSLQLQYATWAEYKHHNTVKILIGISPSGYITFLSDCYGGRQSDKFINQDSEFYENLERDDEVMAVRGFQIREELYHYFCRLVVPPGKRLKSQMTEAECKTTKEVANLRMHVERAINRIKTFRILKTTLPICMLQHVDDIVRSCAALCNLKPVLIRSSR